MQMATARAKDQIQFLQLYVEKDRAASKVTVEKANELGFSGLFLTVCRLCFGGSPLFLSSLKAHALVWHDVCLCPG